jgi:hypothetical protein
MNADMDYYNAYCKFNWSHDIATDVIRLNTLLDVVDISEDTDVKSSAELIKGFETIHDISIEEATYQNAIKGLGYEH